MAQDSLSVQNGTGVAVRQAINTAMQASATNQSGSSAPSTTYPFQFFADTNTNTLKIRNAANNAYINVSGVGQIGAANLGLLPAAGGTISGNLTVSGNFTVQGTTTTVSSTTITVTDKNIEFKKGDLILFPSNFLFPHRIDPVKKGTRYSYISWVW